MKILFSNLLLTVSTLSALHTNADYLVANLAHPFLKKIFKSAAASDSVTLTWATSQVINCIYLGFTNATTLVAYLYDVSDTLLSTIALTASDPGKSFAAVAGVRKAVITITVGSGVVYLGTIGIGAGYTMPDPIADWKDASLDNSARIRSPDGQSMMNKIPPLRLFASNFKVREYETYLAIKDLVDAVSHPVFADPFELAHDKYLPLYCDIDGGFGNPMKGDRQFTFSLNFLEAR
jgi:hypothetical protein